MIVEVNATDGDAGLQVFLDGEPWKSMSVTGPDGRTILDVTTKERLDGYGLTELFSESSEPPFDVFPLEKFKQLFPAGRYSFVGRTIEGARLTGAARLSHATPGGAEDRRARRTDLGSAEPASSVAGRLERSVPAPTSWRTARSSPPKRPTPRVFSGPSRRRETHRGPASLPRHTRRVQARGAGDRAKRETRRSRRFRFASGEGVVDRGASAPQARPDRSPLCREVEAEREQDDRIDERERQRDREPRVRQLDRDEGEPCRGGSDDHAATDTDG